MDTKLTMKKDLFSKSVDLISGKFNTEFNAFLVYGLRIFGAFLTFLLQIFLARWMGKYEYGLFALVWSCLIISGELLSFGFYNLIQRLLPEYRVQGEPELIRGALWGSAYSIIIASILTCGLLYAGLYLATILGGLSSVYATPLMIALLALPAFALSDYLSGIGRSYGWMIRAFAPGALFRPLALMGLLVGLVALGFNASAIVAISVAVISIWMTLILSLAITGFKIPEAERKGPRKYKISAWIWAALPMMMISSFELLLFNVDVLMISHFMEPDQTGIYFAATKIMALVAFLNFAIGSAFNRKYAEAHASANQEELASIIRRSACLTFYPSLIMIFFILILNEEILSLFGQGFSNAEVVIMPLAIGLAFRALIGPGERVLMMTGQQYTCAVIYLGTVVLDIVLNIYLIPAYGIKGAAIATALSFAFMAFMLLSAIKIRLNIISLPFILKT
ncbi:lipopolysaccharide biosynthesis protein [Hyphomicrobiales bacterium 4NK60-0047b]